MLPVALTPVAALANLESLQIHVSKKASLIAIHPPIRTVRVGKEDFMRRPVMISSVLGFSSEDMAVNVERPL